MKIAHFQKPVNDDDRNYLLCSSSYRLITSLVNGCQIVVPKEGNYWWRGVIHQLSHFFLASALYLHLFLTCSFSPFFLLLFLIQSKIHR